MRAILLILIIVLSHIMAAEPLMTRTQMHMGTLVTISLPAENADAIQGAFDLIHDVEMALSSYAPEAEIYRLNQGQTLDDASAYTHEAIALCRHYFTQSRGYFDITIGSITKKAYRFGEDERIPGMAELDEAKTGMEGIRTEGNSIAFEPGIIVDLGGMGKGYAVDKVADYLAKQAISEGVIAASGDIRCLNRCRIEIQNPFEEGIIGSFMTRSPHTAISTSGNYRRYVRDKANNHLIDPKRKRSQKRFASITLIAQLPNSDLDAYATAASVMPFDTAIEFLDAHQLGYVLILNDQTVILSENLDDLTHDLTINPDEDSHNF